MKKIIYIALLFIAFTACEKEDHPEAYNLVNTVWEVKSEPETGEVTGKKYTRTIEKSLTFSTRTAGIIVDRVHVTIEGQGNAYTGSSHTFTYEVGGNSLYLEIEEIPASYTGKINGNTITLKGIDGEEIYTKK